MVVKFPYIVVQFALFYISFTPCARTVSEIRVMSSEENRATDLHSVGTRIELEKVVVENQYELFGEEFWRYPIGEITDPVIYEKDGLFGVFVNLKTGVRMLLGFFRTPDFRFMIRKTLVIATDDPDIILHCTFNEQIDAQNFYNRFYKNIPFNPQYLLPYVKIHLGGDKLFPFVPKDSWAAMFIEDLAPINGKNRRRFTIATIIDNEYSKPYLIFTTSFFDVHNRRVAVIKDIEGVGPVHIRDENNNYVWEAIKNEIILIVKERPAKLHYLQLTFLMSQDGLKFIHDVSVLHEDIDYKLIFDVPFIIESMMGYNYSLEPYDESQPSKPLLFPV